MKTYRMILICLLWAGAAACAQTMGLDQCIEQAMRSNPGLKKSEFGWDQSRISAKQAWAPVMPGISANASSSNSGPLVSEMADQWDWSVGGSVNQTLYSPGLYTRIGQSRAQERSAEYGLKAYRNQVRSSVERLYYQILTSDTLIAVYKANIHLADEQIGKMRQMVELGMKRQSDLLKSEVQRGTFEAQMVREKETLAASIRELNIMMGRDPGSPLRIEPLAVDAVSVPDYDSARMMMLDTNPELRRYKSQIDVQKLSLRIAREAFLPSVSGSYSYSKRNDALSGTDVESDQVRLSLSMDLFDGFRKHRNVALSRLDLESTRLDYESALRDAEDNLLSQYRSMDTQNRLITIHQTSLTSARKDLEVVSQQYAEGFSSILDLTDAQVSVFQSEASLLQDLYMRKRIESEIRRLIGQ
ncbi:TolC family protein [bacterium]|nr:TolC family protein [bacterium]